VIAIADINTTDVGAIAAKVSKAVTPSRKEITPSLNLVLFDPDGGIVEQDVVALRTAMFEVNGVILIVLAIPFVLIGVPVITVIIVFVRDAPPQLAVRGPVGG